MPKLGALSTLLVFAVAMSNVAFGEKIYSEHSVKKDCPYDVMSMFDLPEEQGVSMKDGREIIEQYSPITEQIDYKLYSPGETTLCSSIPGYVEIGWTDKFMPLSQFNTLLTDCGYDPVTLENQHLMITPRSRNLRYESLQQNCDAEWENMFLGGEQNLLPGFCPAGVGCIMWFLMKRWQTCLFRTSAPPTRRKPASRRYGNAEGSDLRSGNRVLSGRPV